MGTYISGGGDSVALFSTDMMTEVSWVDHLAWCLRARNKQAAEVGSQQMPRQAGGGVDIPCYLAQGDTAGNGGTDGATLVLRKHGFPGARRRAWLVDVREITTTDGMDMHVVSNRTSP